MPEENPRVVVIIGASSGIGRATAELFAQEPARLVLAGRRAEGLEEVAEVCRAAGADARVVPTDITDAQQVDELALAAVDAFGRIDVWVNDAGISVFAPFLEMPPEDFRRVIEVDQMGYVNGSRTALTTMTKQGRGRLINVSSIVGEVPQPYTSPYGMAKAAVRALGVSLRSELALGGMRDVHVSTVLPPTIDTPFFGHAANYTGREVIAMPPVYPAEAVATAIVALASRPRPRAEVVVGTLGAALVRIHRMTPRVAEAQMALQTELSQLSRRRRAADTTGNIYEPQGADADAVDGGWRGAERARRRRVLFWVGAAAAGAMLFRSRARAA